MRTTVEQLFLEAYGYALSGKKTHWTKTISADEWVDLYRLSYLQKVSAMIYETVYDCPATRSAGLSFWNSWKHQAQMDTMIQTQKSMEFIRLYREFDQHGLYPVVFKGLVSRSMYPKPDERISADEDILIEPAQFGDYDRLLQEQGYCRKNAMIDDQAFEVTYQQVSGQLVIEMHNSFFPMDNEVYGDLNKLFADCRKRTRTVIIDGQSLKTLGIQDGLLYLLCHSYKHFLHGGTGIRQISDIILYIKQYGKEIDWEKLNKDLEYFRGNKYAGALLKIGQNNMNLDPEQAGIPKKMLEGIDERDLLEDCLQGGVYGGSTLARKHSSTITINRVKEEKKGGRSSSLLQSIFPGAKYLSNRYPVLKKQPYRLPEMWFRRLWSYMKEIHETREVVETGRQRIRLLQEYGILNEPETDQVGRK